MCSSSALIRRLDLSLALIKATQAAFGRPFAQKPAGTQHRHAPETIQS
jgi:hypothetical protein